MTEYEFCKRYPNFKYKVIVKKDGKDSQLLNLYYQLADYFSISGIDIDSQHYKRQINADSDYHVFWFKDEKVAFWFSLKWS